MSIADHRKSVALLSLAISLCTPATSPCATDQIGQSPADLLLEGGHYLRAETLIRAALQRNPNDAHTLSNLSIAEWAFGRLDAAVSDSEKAVAAAPNRAEAHAHLADALGSKLIQGNGGTFERISLAHRFRKEIDRTLELDPNNPDALQDLAQFYWHAPGMVGGDKQKARQTADRLFQIAPYRAAEARADFASDETNIDRRNTAIRTIWQTAVAARPESYEAHAALAAAYLDETANTSHLVMAENEAKRALALDPTRINAYTVLSIVFTRTARFSELDSLLKQSHDHVPDDLTPGYRAAVAILGSNQNQQLQRAEQLLRQYLTQKPEGQQPSHAGAHWRLGQVLERQGRKADAIREFQIAVQQDGSLEDAKKDLKRLS